MTEYGLTMEDLHKAAKDAKKKHEEWVDLQCELINKEHENCLDKQKVKNMMEPLITLLDRIDIGDYFVEDNRELKWRKAFEDLKQELGLNE